MSCETISVYIGCGSNLGDKEALLNRAIDLLGRTAGIEVKTVSPFYVTAPVGYTDQPDFLNGVIEIKTTLSPQDLLKACMETEKELKRERVIRWGPRTIDLDILLYGEQVIEEENLSIPHPRMTERYFVLKPLGDIAPDLVHPVKGITIGQLLEALINTDER